MRSSLPKMLHPVCGRPMVAWPILAAREAGAGRVAVIVSPQARPLAGAARGGRDRRPARARRDRRRPARGDRPDPRRGHRGRPLRRPPGRLLRGDRRACSRCPPRCRRRRDGDDRRPRGARQLRADRPRPRLRRPGARSSRRRPTATPPPSSSRSARSTPAPTPSPPPRWPTRSDGSATRTPRASTTSATSCR